MNKSFIVMYSIVLISFIICITIGTILLEQFNKEKELEFVKAGLEQCETDRVMFGEPKVIWVKDCIKYKQIKGN